MCARRSSASPGIPTAPHIKLDLLPENDRLRVQHDQAPRAAWGTQQPISPRAREAGRAVASAFSAAKRYSEQALNRCSVVSRFDPSLLANRRPNAFAQVQQGPAVARTVVAARPDGRRAFVRGW